METEYFKGVEVEVVEDGGVALDAVVEGDAEGVEGVGVFEGFVDEDFGLGAELLNPGFEGVGAGVVAAAGAGGEDEEARGGGHG